MRASIRFRSAGLLMAALAGAPAFTPTPALGQLISIRTVPVSQEHQFRVFPSHTAAMGGVTIAVSDSLLDPFANPAKGGALTRSYFFTAPSTYGVSSGAGSGHALPSGTFLRRGPWYAGALLAVQDLDPAEQLGQPGLFLRCPTCNNVGLRVPVEPRSPGNQYAFALLGRDVPSAGLSVGASIFWAGLDGVDGVDLLYAGSVDVAQRGSALDLRLGLTKRWDGDRTLEATVLHNRFGMTHDVWYLDMFWDPGAAELAQQPRLDRNLDRSNTWGLHVVHERPLAAEGWRVGWLGTVNYKTHPKIPNYAIMNIPRDPGHSWAFDAGVGFSRTRDTFTFGVDLVYEPIWSYTWADAAVPVTTRVGGTIPEGGKTIENWFRFSNALLRMGLGEEFEASPTGPAITLQLGLETRWIDYRLEQRDNVQLSERELDESWVEWVPTWGIGLRRPTWELRYSGSATNGTGRPGVLAPRGGILEVSTLSAGAAGSNILAAPSGPVSLTPVQVITHQITFALPLR